MSTSAGVLVVSCISTRPGWNAISASLRAACRARRGCAAIAASRSAPAHARTTFSSRRRSTTGRRGSRAPNSAGRSTMRPRAPSTTSSCAASAQRLIACCHCLRKSSALRLVEVGRELGVDRRSASGWRRSALSAPPSCSRLRRRRGSRAARRRWRASSGRASRAGSRGRDAPRSGCCAVFETKATRLSTSA